MSTWKSAITCRKQVCFFGASSTSSFHSAPKRPNENIVPKSELPGAWTRKNGNFQENLKIPKIWAFYGTRENLKVPKNRFDLGKFPSCSNRSIEKGCKHVQPPSNYTALYHISWMVTLSPIGNNTRLSRVFVTELRYRIFLGAHFGTLGIIFG